jgi:uncharacterized protein
VIRSLLARVAVASATVAALAFALAAPARGAAEPVVPPPPQAWVTDTVGALSPSARQALDQKLEAYERQTGHQVLVWIGASTGDVSIEEFATRAFERWKVGRAAKDDGLVFFVLTQDRKMRIEVGYGLEDRVTDLVSGRIIREVVAPRLQANDVDGGIASGVDALLAAIDAGGRAESPPASGPRPLTMTQKIVLGLVGAVLLIFFISNPSLAVWLLLNILSSGSGSGRGGGYGGGGGGWSGGGGRSGGGGASGSW